MNHTNTKRKIILTFFTQLLLLMVLVIILDIVIGNVLSHFYFKQNKGEEFRTTYSIESTTGDILIFGSSRGARQYKPDVFEQRLGLSYYNVSREGYFMFYHEAILRAVLKRYTPKIIILDFRYGEFRKKQEYYDRLSCLLPYYKTHPEIRPVIELRSKFEKLKALSSIYPYNSLLYKIAARNASSYKEERSVTKGYIFNENIWSKPIQRSIDTEQYDIDENIVKSYECFIKSCTDRNIKLLVVVTPYFSIKNMPDASISSAIAIAKKYNVSFIDYSQDTLFLNRAELVADPIHLNDKGAIFLSNMLVDSLKKSGE